MAEDFCSSDNGGLPPASPFDAYEPPQREPVRLILVGSRQGVISLIHTLHLRGIASADDWSALQPEPMTGKWMSLVTKYIRF